MLKASFEKSILVIEKEEIRKKIDLKYEIGEVLCSGNKILVRFKALGEKTPDRNIICLDDEGHQIWQIRDPDEWRTGKKFRRRDLYVGMGFDADNKLWASGGQSDYRIDLNNGDILEEVFTK